jgi:hypothetical protein
MFGMGAEFARYFYATGFLNFGCNWCNDRSICGMAFPRKVTQCFATANGACLETGKVDQVEEKGLDAQARLSEIYRKEAIGAFKDYRELIKGKDK